MGLFFKTKKIINSALFFAAFLAVSKANAEIITVSKTSQSMAPYYWVKDDKTVGILPDILNGIENYNFVFIEIARKRLDYLFSEDLLDISILHPEYTKVDEKLFFIPMNINQETILITTSDNAKGPKNLSKIQNTSICAKRGYVYLNMRTRWIDQALTRIDLDSHSRIIDLVKKKSCKYGITTKLIFQYETHKNKVSGVNATDIVISSVPRYLALSKSKIDLLPKLQSHLEKLTREGTLTEIINRHAPN